MMEGVCQHRRSVNRPRSGENGNWSDCFDYLETAATPRADDPALLEATAPYGQWREGWLEKAIPRLTAPGPSAWQPADFGPTVDADQWHGNLQSLHYAIQDAVDFDADHLYSFFMSGQAWDEETEYASPHAQGRSAARVRIGDLNLRMKQRFLYLFDYGDEHHFEVQLVGVNPDAPKEKYPRVAERHGKNPPQYDMDWEEKEWDEDEDWEEDFEEIDDD
jgi:hypothetical protein